MKYGPGRSDHLRAGVFKSRRSEKIVAVLPRSPQELAGDTTAADKSDTSMLGFYNNRAGRSLSAAGRAAIEKAKAALKVPSDNPDET